MSDCRVVNSDLNSYRLQPVATEGVPLNLARGSQPSNQALEPVPLAESSKRHVGGISVEESRDLMREADLIDRKVERERIKSKHKEQRRKLKKRRREEQVMNLGFASEGMFSRGTSLLMITLAASTGQPCVTATR